MMRIPVLSRPYTPKIRGNSTPKPKANFASAPAIRFGVHSDDALSQFTTAIVQHNTGAFWGFLEGPIGNKRISINSRDKKGYTALHWAAIHGFTDFVTTLLQAGASPNVRDTNDGNTPLHKAIQNGHIETVKAILMAKSDPDIQNLKGNTALHLAAETGKHEIVSLLLQAQANPKIENKQGQTPLALAVRHQHDEASRLLVPSIRLPLSLSPNEQDAFFQALMLRIDG